MSGALSKKPRSAVYEQYLNLKQRAASPPLTPVAAAAMQEITNSTGAYLARVTALCGGIARNDWMQMMMMIIISSMLCVCMGE